MRPALARAAVALAAAALLAGCTGDSSGSPSADRTPDGAPPTARPPLTAGPPAESDLPAGWDQPKDGPRPTPDAALPDAALTALLRTRASVTDAPDRCHADEVSARIAGYDVAAGHRYSTLVVRNDGKRSCVAEGRPGVGARGDRGTTFKPVVEHATEDGDAGRVVLAPGDEAHALVEWTGSLAGSETERASLLVFQLAEGQVPLPVRAVVEGQPALVDIGVDTTLRLGSFRPASR